MSETIKFKYRTAGIANWDDKVLIYRGDTNPYWALPGGKIELGELSHVALQREIMEETGYDVEVGSLAWLSEHIFKRELDDQLIHEVVYYFRMTFPEGSGIYRSGDIPGDESGRKLIFKWIAHDQLSELTVYPTFIDENLRQSNEGILHLAHDVANRDDG